MKDLLNKAFSLGLGLAASTKEQAEKLAQELSARSDMSKADSQQFVSSMISRGQEARSGMETFIRERVKDVTDELELAHRSELARLEARVAELEARLGAPSAHAPEALPHGAAGEDGAYEGTGKAGPGVPPSIPSAAAEPAGQEPGTEPDGSVR
ncbi:hypothetical protein HGI30_01170 [Paenibacillus albicereus]|uniref:Polyhydroxyalkanoate synthesis regulator n=1 Tax=Paenibacillus albicereus TaxID=2726185 RepID=A0A6H2GSH4_9BACL|nr:hypothetical protein [Paenibacillus albicereus]QJC50347.1 hypothetical protein HGI30_01170 [Paenibacillus albicereus]